MENFLLTLCILAVICLIVTTCRLDNKLDELIETLDLKIAVKLSPKRPQADEETSDTKAWAVPGVGGAQKVPSTVVLPGMPGLEWMTENLKGYGGTEIDGRTYYTHPEALEAVRQLGNGWRLPTFEEFEALAKLESEWQNGPHGLPGRLFEDRLFLEAAGFRGYASGALGGVGALGNCWSSSRTAGSLYAGGLGFNSGYVYPLYGSHRALGFSVRCVRNIQ